MKAIYTALAAFQQEVPAIKKNASGYGYKFADLDEITKSIKPLMAKYKLGFTQPIDGTKLKTILFHTESGESIEGCAEIPQGVSLKGQNEFQTMGSAITYLRRYGLVSMLGLVTDEDADAAGETKKTPAKTNNVADNAKFRATTVQDVADLMNAPMPDFIPEFPDLERGFVEYQELDPGGTGTSRRVRDTVDNTLSRAKVSINEMLETQGYNNPIKKKAFISKVLKKSTIDTIDDANKVADALEFEG